MKKNKRGFLLSEALVVATVLLTALVVIYAQYAKIYIKINSSKNYNTEDSIYSANKVGSFLSDSVLVKGAYTCKGTALYKDLSTCGANISGITALLTNLDISKAYIIESSNIASTGIPDADFNTYLTFLQDKLGTSTTSSGYRYLIVTKTLNGAFGYSYLNYSPNMDYLLDNSATSDLVAYWKLNGTGADSSGYGNTATLFSSVNTNNRTNTASKAVSWGAPGSIDTTYGYMTVPYTASLSLNSFTISTWIKPNRITYPEGVSLFKNTTGANNCYSSKYAGFEFGTISIPKYATNEIYACLGDGTNNAYGTIALNGENTLNGLLNRWLHFLIVVDRNSNYISVYINGKRQSSKISTSGVTGTTTNANGLTMGYIYGYKTDGSVDDLRIYKRALTSLEVAWLYNKEYTEGELD